MKVIILKGLPASGKSTIAKELVAKSGYNYQRINKDDLRHMLHDSQWSKNNEKIILKTRDALINLYLSEGKSVIIDDTNFHQPHIDTIKSIAEKYGAECEVRFIDTPLEECIARDLKRPNSVGKDVIMRMYNQYLKPKREDCRQDPTLPDCYIVDIDGTVASMVNRSPYDWKNVSKDAPRPFVIDLVKTLYASGNKIIFFTGRDGICYDDSYKWLQDNVNIEFELYSRAQDDSRKDSVIKKELFDNHVKNKYFVKGVIDDRLQVCQMWYQMGLEVFRVGDPDANF